MTMGRVVFAVLLSAILAGAGSAMAACPDTQPPSQQAKKSAANTPCLSLGAVPQISAQVVAGEPAPVVKPRTYEGLPAEKPYEGPRLGLTKPDPAVRPVPTVGFHWTLD
jgi:hypothetical protein